MKINSIKLFIKQKQILIDKTLGKLIELNKKFNEVERDIINAQKFYISLNEIGEQTVFCLKNKEKKQKEIKKIIQNYEHKKQKLNTEIKQLKEILKQYYSEKKALEKMLNKEEKNQQNKKVQQENNLANENFIRKNFTLN